MKDTQAKPLDVQPTGLRAFHELGPLSWAAERMFWALQYFTLAFILGNPFRATVQTKAKVPWETTRRRARFVEQYIILWFCLEILAAVVVASSPGRWLRWTVRIVLSLHLVEIVQVVVNMNVFDHIRVMPRRHSVSSLVRALILSVWNYIELIIVFGVLYASLPGSLTSATPLAPYYFSVVTQLTVGYGDVLPLGPARVLAAIQAIIGSLFLVVILGRFVSVLPPMKADVEDDQ